MADYILYRKTKCPGREDFAPCEDGTIWMSNPTADPPVEPFPVLCRACDGDGWIKEEVDLLEVLAKVRWSTVVERLPNGNTITQEHQFENVEIED